jgi:hypothetical protein
MDDRRRATDHREGLARQAGRAHAGRDEDDRGHFAIMLGLDFDAACRQSADWPP